MIEKSRGFIIKKSDGRISRANFHTKYIEFCTSKHYTIRTPSTVTRQVEKLGYKSHKSNGIWYWLGVDVPKEGTKDNSQEELF